MEPTNQIKQLIEGLIRRVILHPEHLEIVVTQDGRLVVVTMRAHGGDTGRLIGKGRSTFNALATLASLLGAKHGLNVQMNPVLEAVVGEPDRYPPFKPRRDWPCGEILDHIAQVCAVILEHPVIAINANHHAVHSIITIEANPDENAAKLRLAGRALLTIFATIGKCSGRVLYVNLNHQHNTNDEYQHLSDGRQPVPRS